MFWNVLNYINIDCAVGRGGRAGYFEPNFDFGRDILSNIAYSLLPVLYIKVLSNTSPITAIFDK